MKTGERADLLKKLTFKPLSPETWDQFVQLFGERGACGNCWCMFYRLKKADLDEGKKNNGNKASMQQLVRTGQPTGMLGFYEGQAIAWCAFAPREAFLKLENSRVHKRLDDLPVWSIPCFFIGKNFRRQGVSVELLKAVIDHAKKNKIKCIEAYPVNPKKGRLPDAFAWIGLLTSFQRAGFKIVDRTSKNRPMVRYTLDDSGH